MTIVFVLAIFLSQNHLKHYHPCKSNGMARSMEIKYRLSTLLPNCTIANTKKYFQVRLLIENEWFIRCWDNVRVLIEFWNQGVNRTPFDAILMNDNTIFNESISYAKKMIVSYCLSTVNSMKEDELGFICPLSKQSNSPSMQYHYTLSLMYCHKLACCCREGIAESVCWHFDMKLKHNLQLSRSIDSHKSSCSTDCIDTCVNMINSSCLLNKYQNYNEHGAFQMLYYTRFSP